MSNCKNEGNIVANGTEPASGLVSILQGTATFNYCVNTGKITAEQSYASGIGYTLYGSDSYNYCYNSGAIYGADCAVNRCQASVWHDQHGQGLPERRHCCFQRSEVSDCV